jgi:predicted DsbA family dithiol-disulfide isomerase
MSTPTTEVDLYVDPACPWAWLTSRWLVEVERVRPVRVITRLFCLAEINRDAEADDRLRRAHEASERALRCLVQARREGGDAALAALYTSIGDAYQERAEPVGDPETLEAAAQQAGIDGGAVARALSDPSTLDDLLREHRHAVEVLGAFGVPTLVIGAHPAIFGPIVDRRLEPAEAGELWDHTRWLIENARFFELKRNRTGRATIGRYAAASAKEAATAAQTSGGAAHEASGTSG